MNKPYRVEILTHANQNAKNPEEALKRLRKKGIIKPYDKVIKVESQNDGK